MKVTLFAICSVAMILQTCEKSPYPFTKEIDCDAVSITIGTKGELVFDFKKKQSEKCPCTEFGWIQHVANADTEVWRYDNGVLSSPSTPKRIGAKSDPSRANQPTTPPSGTKLEDWDENPWYGGTTDRALPKNFGEHPTPQTHISDRPDETNTKYKTQLVCVKTGQVFLTWEWGPLRTGQEALDKIPGSSVAPP